MTAKIPAAARDEGADSKDQHHFGGRLDAAEPIRDHLLQSAHVIRRLVRIHIAQLLADRRRQASRDLQRFALQSPKQFGLLRKWHVCGRSGIMIQWNRLHVTHDSHDRA